MSSGWFPPREDCPSVLSNRVFSIRRLNKMEAQRLGSQLNNLDAEKAQTQALISQEQKALIRELTQIREIKDNSAVSSERRKLLQQTSSKESQLPYRHHLTGETVKQQAAHTRFRSLSTGQCPPMHCSRLPSLHGRQRSLSTTCPPLCLGREELTGMLRCKESGSLQDVNNNTAQKGYNMYTSRNEKLRQRSLSTGTRPRTSAWVGGKSDFEVSSYTKVKDWQNRGVSEDCLDLEFKQTPKSSWELEMRRDTEYDMNKDALSRLKLNSSNGSYVCDRRQTKGVIRDDLSKFAPMRRVRSYSTNSAPIISEGRVVGLGAAGKTTIVPQRFDTASQRRRKHSTSFAPKADEGEEHHNGSNENTYRNEELQRIPLLPTRRHRSLSTNCPPVVKEGIVVEDENNNEKLKFKTNTEEKRRNSLNDETKERNISTKNVLNDKDFDESWIDHSDFSVPPDTGRDGKGHEDDTSLLALQ